MLDPAVKAVQFVQAAVGEFDESATAQRSGLRSRSLVCLACWIGASFVMIGMNKWLYRENGFPFPILLTCMQMATTFFCCAFLFLFDSLKPQREDAQQREFNLSAFDFSNEQFQTDAARVVSAGFFYALSLSCGSVAYLYLTVPCMQMMKASLPVFTLMFMFSVGLEEYSFRYLQIVMVICGGLIIYLWTLLYTAGHENDLRFSGIGFVLQAIGIFADCMRLTFLNLLVGRRKNASNHQVLPVLMAVSLVAAVALGCVWGVLEAPQFDWSAFSKVGHSMLLANCIWGFVVTWTVFQLVRETSALVLTLGGLIKNVIVISISRVVAHASSVSATKALGYACALFGVYAFLEFKKNPSRFQHGLCAGMMQAWFGHKSGTSSSSNSTSTNMEVGAFDQHLKAAKQRRAFYNHSRGSKSSLSRSRHTRDRNRELQRAVSEPNLLSLNSDSDCDFDSDKEEVMMQLLPSSVFLDADTDIDADVDIGIGIGIGIDGNDGKSDINSVLLNWPRPRASAPVNKSADTENDAVLYEV